MDEIKIQKIFDALKDQTLTERERFVMRKELELLMKEHPLKVPFHIRVFEQFNAFDAMALNYVSSHSIAAAALVLVLVGGVGTSYAASGALPGDVLYPVKIQINERVQGALAVSDVAKVEWSTAQTERRLEEAEVLAAKGTLNDQNSSEIADQLTSSKNDFETRVAALAEQPGGDEAASDAQSDFDASISAHENVLSKLGDHIPDARSAITPILATVRSGFAGAHVAKAAPTLMMASLEIGSSTPKNPGDKVTAERRKLRAEKKLKEVRDLATQARDTLGTTSFSYFHGEASSTESAISDGDKNVDEGNFDEAIRSYQEAIKASSEAKAGLNAEIHLRQNVHMPNLDFISVSNNGDTNNEGDGSGKSN